MEKIDLMQILQTALLVFEGVSQSDLMVKHGFKSRNVIKGKELLDWLNKT